MSQRIQKDTLGYVFTKMKSALSGKVDKIHGKGLSTEDYTPAEKEKLNNVYSGANASDVSYQDNKFTKTVNGSSTELFSVTDSTSGVSPDDTNLITGRTLYYALQDKEKLISETEIDSLFT